MRTAEPLLRQLRPAPWAAEEVSDCALLERFSAERDEAAFAELVRRHGPMVLAICRRLLRQEQDAEDGFQATFLALVRRAPALRWHHSAAGWLHTVAGRLARKLQLRRLRQQARERDAAHHPAAPEAAHELSAALDEEVRRLPARHREPLVLIYLEGLTRDEAAARMGWSLRTLDRRL